MIQIEYRYSLDMTGSGYRTIEEQGEDYGKSD
jgi:hypothetical protein